MADDMEIIVQIEKKIGEKLKRLPLEKIIASVNGYAMDKTGQVQGLSLYKRKIKGISLLKNLGGLIHLSLAANQITDLTPLRELKQLVYLAKLMFL